jgi:hypothetical protein
MSNVCLSASATRPAFLLIASGRDERVDERLLVVGPNEPARPSVGNDRRREPAASVGCQPAAGSARASERATCAERPRGKKKSAETTSPARRRRRAAALRIGASIPNRLLPAPRADFSLCLRGLVVFGGKATPALRASAGLCGRLSGFRDSPHLRYCDGCARLVSPDAASPACDDASRVSFD